MKRWKMWSLEGGTWVRHMLGSSVRRGKLTLSNTEEKDGLVSCKMFATYLYIGELNELANVVSLVSLDLHLLKM